MSLLGISGVENNEKGKYWKEKIDLNVIHRLILYCNNLKHLFWFFSPRERLLGFSQHQTHFFQHILYVALLCLCLCLVSYILFTASPNPWKEVGCGRSTASIKFSHFFVNLYAIDTCCTCGQPWLICWWFMADPKKFGTKALLLYSIYHIFIGSKLLSFCAFVQT